VVFRSAGQRHRISAAAVVVAAGIQLADAAISTDSRFVLSLSEFARRYENDTADRPDTIVFWLDRIEPEWKAHARKCLRLALAHAERGGHAAVIMQKMLVHGLMGQQLYDEARRKGVRFLRMHDPSQLKLDSGGDRLKLTLNEETLAGMELRLDCDLLVVPEPVKNPPMAAEIAAVIRQPRDVEGFLQSANVRHRPIGSPRKGIFFIGSCHAECDRADLLHEIEALKAALATLDMKDFELDQPPAINENQCVRCLTCFRVCPHGAVTIRNHYQPVIVPQACFGCGLCVTNCPAVAIDPARPSDPNATGAPAEGETIVFACERSAGLALDAARDMGFDPGNRVRIVPVRCAGSLDEITLLQLAAGGAKRVIVAGCHEGNCRSMEGSGFAAARANKIAADMGAADGPIRHVTIAANEPLKLSRILTANGSEKEES
jgi:heterodisulfide reductase subunit A